MSSEKKCTCTCGINRLALLGSLIGLALLWFWFFGTNSYKTLGRNLNNVNNPLQLTSISQWLNGNNNETQISAIDTTSTTTKTTTDTNAPAWFTYLKTNNYEGFDMPYASFQDADKVLTRATVTPYLVQYAKNTGLTLDTSRECNFPDISAKNKNLQESIKTTCEYGLMRGKNGNFEPDVLLKKHTLLAILITSKYGKLEETQDPRYQVYINKAKEVNMITGDLATSNWTEGVTLKEFGTWVSQIK